ncbi:hypothetical protein [Amycolatopsis taiwanensis]|uniref:Uncharacterized protein n=1 Tax=Amycolatopsis taiwanensis TaxID=342230 RepID=A0A9W6R0X3_9PSEU|nr:hypothetical protein [Amycolatopsis taiwanensis]GLY67124.1 hypothetical protein Atai01_37430 [Amycolatopsis taiwanensis]
MTDPPRLPLRAAELLSADEARPGSTTEWKYIPDIAESSSEFGGADAGAQQIAVVITSVN